MVAQALAGLVPAEPLTIRAHEALRPAGPSGLAGLSGVWTMP